VSGNIVSDFSCARQSVSKRHRILKKINAFMIVLSRNGYQLNVSLLDDLTGVEVPLDASEGAVGIRRNHRKVPDINTSSWMCQPPAAQF